MSCSVFQVSIYGWLSAMDHVGVSGTGESTPTEVCINGWNSTCQPCIESATALSDYE